MNAGVLEDPPPAAAVAAAAARFGCAWSVIALAICRNTHDDDSKIDSKIDPRRVGGTTVGQKGQRGRYIRAVVVWCGGTFDACCTRNELRELQRPTVALTLHNTLPKSTHRQHTIASRADLEKST